MNSNPPRYRRNRPYGVDDLPLHERIRKRRVSLGLTGQELAERAGVSPPYISLIEKGVKIPSEDVAEAIARALQDDPELYRAWAHSGRIEDIEGAWTSLHLARRYARSPLLRSRISSGESLEGEAAAARAEYEAFEAETSPGPAAETKAREAPDELMLSSHREPALASSRGLFARSRRDTEPVELPVLEAGADPGNERIPTEAIQDVLLLDSRVFGRGKPTRPFAYRLNEAMIARVLDLFRPGDWVVVDSRPGGLTADRVHAVRLHGRVILSRVLAKRDSLLLLPTEGQSDVQVLDLPPGEPLDRVIVGCVVVTIRGEG